ncbi:MAG: NAD-dependent epimerase/dehydratase family protein, partial [Acidobacteriota bacterium]|nr:NAD-dependent epimerase/dehydratase family protein [Acidobacteriota bacterium]
MKVLILGVNGFIGNSLVRAILEKTDWEVVGMDRSSDKLEHSLGRSRFQFEAGDITSRRSWIDRQIRRCDVVVPLVAIATPMAYVRKPLRVFELTFEE